MLKFAFFSFPAALMSGGVHLFAGVWQTGLLAIGLLAISCLLLAAGLLRRP